MALCFWLSQHDPPTWLYTKANTVGLGRLALRESARPICSLLKVCRVREAVLVTHNGPRHDMEKVSGRLAASFSFFFRVHLGTNLPRNRFELGKVSLVMLCPT